MPAATPDEPQQADACSGLKNHHLHLMELVTALDMDWGRPDASFVFVALSANLCLQLLFIDLVREAHGGKF